MIIQLVIWWISDAVLLFIIPELVRILLVR
jgi:hypothetical protein